MDLRSFRAVKEHGRSSRVNYPYKNKSQHGTNTIATYKKSWKTQSTTKVISCSYNLSLL